MDECSKCERIDSLKCKNCIYSPRIVDNFKPKIDIIDLKPLVGSNILCEFSDKLRVNHSDSVYIGVLHHIGDDPVDGIFYKDHNGAKFKKCMVKQDFWFNWFGGTCPLPSGFIVEVLIEGKIAMRVKGDVDSFDWHNHNINKRITSFRVIERLNRFKYAWEGKML